MNDAFRLLASLLGLVFGSIGKLFSPLRAQIYSPIPQSHSPVGVPHPHRASAAAARCARMPHFLSARRPPHFSPPAACRTSAPGAATPICPPPAAHRRVPSRLGQR